MNGSSGRLMGVSEQQPHRVRNCWSSRSEWIRNREENPQGFMNAFQFISRVRTHTHISILVKIINSTLQLSSFEQTEIACPSCQKT